LSDEGTWKNLNTRNIMLFLSWGRSDGKTRACTRNLSSLLWLKLFSFCISSLC